MTPHPMTTLNIRENTTDAIKFWEPRRVAYNLVLAAIVLIYFAVSYPLSRAKISVDLCLTLFQLAVGANIAYCAAYVVDIFAQSSAFRESWHRHRWLLFVIGTGFAAIFARFIAIGMFRPGH